MGGCGGWSAVPIFCLKPDFVRNCRLNFKVSPDHPMAHLLFVSCVSFVLSRVGLGQIFGGCLPRGAQPSEPEGLSEGRRGGGIGH